MSEELAGLAIVGGIIMVIVINALLIGGVFLVVAIYDKIMRARRPPQPHTPKKKHKPKSDALDELVEFVRGKRHLIM